MNYLNKIQYDLVLKLKRNEEPGVMYTKIYGDEIGEYLLLAYIPMVSELKNKLIEIGRVILNPNGSTTINITYPMIDRYDNSRTSGGVFYGRFKFNINLAISKTELIYKIAKSALDHLIEGLENLMDPKIVVMNIATSLDIEEMIYLDSYEYDMIRKDSENTLNYQLRIMDIDDINLLRDIYE